MARTTRGPWRTLTTDDGESVPFYVIPFDKAGACTGPRSLDDLVADAADATDVFCFAHGWNNDWPAATARYLRFVDQYVATRRARWNPPDREYRPLLAGVFWPSTALVEEDRSAPDFAGSPDAGTGTGTGTGAQPQQQAELQAIAEALGGEAPARFYDLATRDELSRAEATELARMLAPLLSGTDDELGEDVTRDVDADELIEIWTAVDRVNAPVQPRPRGGFVSSPAGAGPAPGPEVAGLLDLLNPRNIVRTSTVLLMKDRAGRVGGTGVAAMLRRLVDASDSSRVHLIGHSYGCKVVLSALCNGAAPRRQVESVLLLQPALSALCFARDTGEGRPGGYRSALVRTRQPLVTTFSRHDDPLTKLFHLAARRRSDLGEAVIAAGPSRFAALGGFGPAALGAESATVGPALPPQPYDLSVQAGRPRVLAIKADDVIANHGAVENQATAWALLCQVMVD
jgi:pimeloyl-ACP methyl ester carboxylesterase